ncbi:N-acetyl-alpha-D-glucosaminyl L-malate synthase BshA [Salipaludibacillus aurantiacus]|uniref:N-acetyl-alpha-D-glucosaminyl L-malate synthase BshA n=1 Tax=Salipaludibacillus aurantiacus TaxID=1601833 RepID=A0A1H9P716_9BACI|nr:N-acetyl-alpha-D-glucosaminyl L-malate synthase BshA [Salipaludibacillus aurantiacus]SER43599.1 N-acetyl-alpha-D-glucosaminyl L-malate synthase BshA [Salipaludibacillus aurantiacus]
MTYKIGITCYPTVGGSGVVATELGKALAEKGHEVHFITSSLPFRLDEQKSNIFFHEVEVNQYSVFRYPPYDLALASKMADVIKREGLDLLHVHYAIPHAISAYLAKEMVEHDVKVVTTLHGTDITVLGYDPSLSDMIRFGIEKSDMVTAVSDSLITQTKDLLRIDKPIETVYNFVDHRIYYPRVCNDLREDLKIQENQKVISHVSNFRKVKRVQDVVKTFDIIRRQKDAVLLLIGEGPELPVICDLVNELGLKEHVRFLGNQKRVADLLSMSDLKLLLSEKESFGLVILEAMACGVPVIGTDIGGIPEVIEHGKSGYISRLGDLEEAAGYAVHLLDHPEIQESMAEAAVKRAVETFHRDRIVSDYETIYDKALKKRG